jgi:hypothetical protein
MSDQELEDYKAEKELELRREYHDVAKLYRYAVATQECSYLANQVDLQVHGRGQGVYFEAVLTDAWAWDVNRSARFLTSAKVVTIHEINVQELDR